MPKISIIVPVYNVERFLPQCLESILAQTFTDFELLLIDDGSGDRSGQICDEVAQKDSRIQVFHQQNAGQSSARNFGMDLAEGDYLCFIDSDDFITPDYLEQLYGLVEKYDVDLASCAFTTDPKKKDQGSLKEHLFEGNQQVMEAFLRAEHFVWTPWAKLFRAELCRELRYELHREFEDNYFDYQFFKKANKVAAIDYIGYFYVVHTDSTSRRPFYPAQFDVVTEERKIVADVKTYYPELLKVEANNLALKYYYIFARVLKDKNIFSSEMKPHVKQLRGYYKEDKDLLKSLSIRRRYQLYLVGASRFPYFVAGLNRIYHLVTKR